MKTRYKSIIPLADCIHDLNSLPLPESFSSRGGLYFLSTDSKFCHMTCFWSVERSLFCLIQREA